jgi:hypothetical protein
MDLHRNDYDGGDGGGGGESSWCPLKVVQLDELVDQQGGPSPSSFRPGDSNSAHEIRLTLEDWVANVQFSMD